MISDASISINAPPDSLFIVVLDCPDQERGCSRIVAHLMCGPASDDIKSGDFCATTVPFLSPARIELIFPGAACALEQKSRPW